MTGMWLAIIGGMLIAYSQLGLSGVRLGVLDPGGIGYTGFMVLLGVGIIMFIGGLANWVGGRGR